MAFKPLAIICRPIGVLVGFVYPAYASYKALESKTPEAAAQWLTYWVVFSLFSVFEYVADFAVSWIPLYYAAKLAFVIWLMAPQTKGATTLYVRYIMPLIKQHEESIDNALEQGYKKGENTLQDLRQRSMAFLRAKGILASRATGAGADVPGARQGGGATDAPPKPPMVESKATV